MDDQSRKDFGEYVNAWRARLAQRESERRIRVQQLREVARACARRLVRDFGAREVYLFGSLLDEDLPSGTDWHVQLLQRMATGIETVRPAVLDRETARQLDEYLRFRHLFRNVYGFDLEWERCRELLDDLPATFERLSQRLALFDESLLTLERAA